MTRILLAGDSTVADQPREPDNPALRYCGWGQMPGRFTRPGAEVSNFAVSGYTVMNFREKGRYDALKARLRPGDFVLFQFGHNDQKLPELPAAGAYKSALIRYIREIRALGGRPVLVTSVARNSWRGDNLEYNDLLAPYAAAVIAAGEESGAAVLNLHTASVEWIRGLGLLKAKRFFYPGDYTHPNDYGAYRWARMTAELIITGEHSEIRDLASLLMPSGKWIDMGEPATDPVTGWTGPPGPRCDFSFLPDDGALTVKEALETARQGYAYFAVNDEELSQDLPMAYRAAVQSGYLPPGFPYKSDDLDKPIQAGDFWELMNLAGKGRGEVPQVITWHSLNAGDSAVSWAEAKRFAIARRQ
ncbi:MAG: GDSL-type esterase/lipase family protein [Clostridiales bacterium]|jgi:lysophospholipase L1-like esterase|nr:GDSL-type esterase/lipase family protein [Clostridiales bacterium]